MKLLEQLSIPLDSTQSLVRRAICCVLLFLCYFVGLAIATTTGIESLALTIFGGALGLVLCLIVLIRTLGSLDRYQWWKSTLFVEMGLIAALDLTTLVIHDLADPPRLSVLVIKLAALSWLVFGVLHFTWRLLKLPIQESPEQNQNE